MFFHGNAIINRANELAEVAADTFFLFYGVRVIRFTVFEMDGLMRCIFTGNIAKAAMDALVLVDVGDVVVVDVQIFPMRNSGD
jgi:hypothetical protein